MKKNFTILMTLFIVTIITIGQTNQTSVEYDTYIADQNTASLSEDVSSTETIPDFNSQE